MVSSPNALRLTLQRDYAIMDVGILRDLYRPNIWKKGDYAHMTKVRQIKEYKAIQDGKTTIEIPVSDKESQPIMELNFNNYVNILSDIIVKYSSNFRVGRHGQMPATPKIA